jgi:hypothetical protein
MAHVTERIAIPRSPERDPREAAEKRTFAMTFAGVNYLAILIAAIAAFLFGGAWYGVLGKAWMAALGKSEAEIKGRGLPASARLAVAFAALLLMAWMLAGVIGHLGAGQVSLRNGAISGFLLWLGFVITTQIVNYTFQSQSQVLTLIDGGHWLGVLLIEGAIIGAVGL